MSRQGKTIYLQRGVRTRSANDPRYKRNRPHTPPLAGKIKTDPTSVGEKQVEIMSHRALDVQPIH